MFFLPKAKTIIFSIRVVSELVCAQSVTARIFTAREGAQMHCQVGNSGLARTEILRWLSRFYQAEV